MYERLELCRDDHPPRYLFASWVAFALNTVPAVLNRGQTWLSCWQPASGLSGLWSIDLVMDCRTPSHYLTLKEETCPKRFGQYVPQTSLFLLDW